MNNTMFIKEEGSESNNLLYAKNIQSEDKGN
jgi:hypothetical protein